jgi:hypothetical protein
MFLQIFSPYLPCLIGKEGVNDLVDIVEKSRNASTLREMFQMRMNSWLLVMR